MLPFFRAKIPNLEELKDAELSRTHKHDKNFRPYRAKKNPRAAIVMPSSIELAEYTVEKKHIKPKTTKHTPHQQNAPGPHDKNQGRVLLDKEGPVVWKESSATQTKHREKKKRKKKDRKQEKKNKKPRRRNKTREKPSSIGSLNSKGANTTFLRYLLGHGHTQHQTKHQTSEHDKNEDNKENTKPLKQTIDNQCKILLSKAL